jgi:hypothetical protein
MEGNPRDDPTRLNSIAVEELFDTGYLYGMAARPGGRLRRMEIRRDGEQAYEVIVYEDREGKIPGRSLGRLECRDRELRRENQGRRVNGDGSAHQFASSVRFTLDGERFLIVEETVRARHWGFLFIPSSKRTTYRYRFEPLKE